VNPVCTGIGGIASGRICAYLDFLFVANAVPVTVVSALAVIFVGMWQCIDVVVYHYFVLGTRNGYANSAVARRDLAVSAWLAVLVVVVVAPILNV